MKDFTTPEYINPIIDEINARYNPILDPVILAALSADVLLTAGKYDNIAVRAGQPFSCLGEAAGRATHSAIQEYANATETYDGELDTWKWQEWQRVNTAVRDQLIRQHTAG